MIVLYKTSAGVCWKPYFIANVHYFYYTAKHETAFSGKISVLYK